VQIAGIIDTASTVNVLPHHIGLALGAVWEEQQELGYLAGALSGIECRGLAVNAHNPEIADGLDVPLLFAWANSDAAPILFGQTIS